MTRRRRPPFPPIPESAIVSSRPAPLAKMREQGEKAAAVETLELDLRSLGGIASEFMREVAFAAPDRRWRFDFAWPRYAVALEVEGGVWLAEGGRHNRGAGYVRDLEKYNEAAIRGWMLLRVTTDQAIDGTARELVLRALAPRLRRRSGVR